MSCVHRSLRDLGLAEFCSGARDAGALATKLSNLLGAGTTRSEWCWAAFEGGRPLARQIWWSTPGAVVPAGVELVTTSDPAAACDLLTSVRGRLGVPEASCELYVPIEEGSGPSASQKDDVRVLEGAGFVFAFARVSVEWILDAGLPAGSGDLVGYVVPGLAGDAPMIAEIGVAATQRGNRYVDDLLAEGTRVLAEDGAARVIADTDLLNAPMRTAFGRCGYREYRWRDDYHWLVQS